MKVSVIVEDRCIIVDGVPFIHIEESRWPAAPADVWCWHWDGTSGCIEYTDTGIPHGSFDNVSPIQPYIDLHATLVEEEATARAAHQAEMDALIASLTESE